MPRLTPLTPADATVVETQLGRPARGVAGVAWRCPLGRPGVVATSPSLPDGSPFPTLYYLTCPRAVTGCSTLESEGAMAAMTARLSSDPELAAAYRAAHEAYLADRAALGDVPAIAGFSAGGMPTRVKCLHALVGHALAAGPGVNPFGDEALALLGEFRCVSDPDDRCAEDATRPPSCRTKSQRPLDQPLNLTQPQEGA